MPKGDSDEAATLLPKLMELRSKVEHIEGQAINCVPVLAAVDILACFACM